MAICPNYKEFRDYFRLFSTSIEKQTFSRCLVPIYDYDINCLTIIRLSNRYYTYLHNK